MYIYIYIYTHILMIPTVTSGSAIASFDFLRVHRGSHLDDVHLRSKHHGMRAGVDVPAGHKFDVED